MNKKIKCHCCGYYTIDSEDEIVVDICEVCLWQYDEMAQNNPEKIIGPNKISLSEAKENYKQFGVSKKRYIGENLNRMPSDDEISQSK